MDMRLIAWGGLGENIRLKKKYIVIYLNFKSIYGIIIWGHAKLS